MLMQSTARVVAAATTSDRAIAPQEFCLIAMPDRINAAGPSIGRRRIAESQAGHTDGEVQTDISDQGQRLQQTSTSMDNSFVRPT